MRALPEIFLSIAAEIPSVAGLIWFGEIELPSQFISVSELSLWVGATKIFVTVRFSDRAGLAVPNVQLR
jgi:hypothetical protein